MKTEKKSGKSEPERKMSHKANRGLVSRNGNKWDKIAAKQKKLLVFLHICNFCSTFAADFD